MFRHERPQKGRFRQFYQVDVEAIGFPGPDVDAELIALTARLWQRLGITRVKLQINSLGTAESRRAYRELLVTYFRGFEAQLDADSRRRLEGNPLRILDSKNPAMQEMIAGAPRLLDRLGDASRAHFEGVQQLLGDQGIAFEINPRLVRGLDYYNRTVFEWITDRLGAQGTVAGGGRYDGLIEQLGGKPTPACGFAIGVERMVLLLQEAGTVPVDAPLAYVVHAGEAAGRLAARAGEMLRDASLAIVVNAGGGSFKSQMKKADASGARFALIIGDDEVATGVVGVKPLRESGEQTAVPLDRLAAVLIERAA
jgi:histidyl-tRNA synthetase